VLTIFGFRRLRDKVLDHQIWKSAKSDLSMYKGGNFSKLFVSTDFLKGK
jgi:hypothetical protein